MGRIEQIRREIKAHNYSNAILNELVPKVQEVFKDSVGELVVKSGTYPQIYLKYEEKINEILKEFREKMELSYKLDETYKYPRIYLSISGYSCSVDLSFEIADHKRHERYCYILNLRDRKLESIPVFEPFKEINEEEEIKKFEKASKLKEEFEKAKDEIGLYSIRGLI